MKKKILMMISFAGLALVVVPAFLVMLTDMNTEAQKWWMLGGTILYFSSAPFWLIDQNEQEDTHRDL